jgi:ribonuclease G
VSYELIVQSKDNKASIALTKDKKLVELHDASGIPEFSVGDVYLGRVKKVVPNLNAAFVDVGYKKDAFLHYLDLGPQFRTFDKFTNEALKNDGTNFAMKKVNFQPEIPKDGKISEILTQGKLVAVQVTKEPISSKGPRLTCEVTLAGRYVVLVPFSNKVSISQRIKSPEERDRLRRLMQSIRPSNCGVIIRTVAENKKVAELDSDLRELVERWEDLEQGLKASKPPKRVLGELNKTSAILRDLVSPAFSAIHVDDEVMHSEIKDYLHSAAPEKEKIVKHYSGKSNVFEVFGINKQIKASFGKQVNLSSGAYLIVEHTEAMHVIDVNSGNRKTQADTQEQNALETNLECAEEIARVLRLRDMGGIIAVDFIDMAESANNQKLHDKLRELLKEDKAKSHVLAPSKFGVVEITRQRVRPETEIKTAEVCPACNGTGEVTASVLLTDEIMSDLYHVLENYTQKKVVLVAHPFITSYLSRGLRTLQLKMLLKYKKWVSFRPNSTFHMLEYAFLDESGKEIKYTEDEE